MKPTPDDNVYQHDHDEELGMYWYEAVGPGGERVDEDVEHEAKLRPRSMIDYIGQDKIRAYLQLSIAAARQRREALGHVLLYGAPGLGKTTLAYVVANELGVAVHATSGQELETPGDLAAVLTNLRDRDVLLIDDINWLPPSIQEMLHLAMQANRLDVAIGEGRSTVSVGVPLQKFTVIGATTRPELLSASLRCGFAITHGLELYQPSDIEKIVHRSAGILSSLPIDDRAAKEIAGQSQGTPRIANRLLVQERALTEKKLKIQAQIAAARKKWGKLFEDDYQKAEQGGQSEIIAYMNENRVSFEHACEAVLLPKSQAQRATLRTEVPPERSRRNQTETHVAPSESSGSVGLSRVAGMHQLKALLRRDVVTPIRNPVPYRRYGLSIPNGILLFGPPGCGKTYIARLLAEELGHHFIEVIPSELASPYIHDSVTKIRELFDDATEKAPTVMFIDEFEALVPSRGGLGGHQQYKSEEVNEFLAHLNGCSDKKIFVIAATNRPEMIDPAVRRTGRLDKLIYVGPPDLAAREEMLALHLGGRPVGADVHVQELAKLLDGYSASDIRFLVDEAARDALMKSQVISRESFRLAIATVEPSVPAAVEAEYQSIQQRGATRLEKGEEVAESRAGHAAQIANARKFLGKQFDDDYNLGERSKILQFMREDPSVPFEEAIGEILSTEDPRRD